MNAFFKNSTEFATIVVAFLTIGFSLPVAVVIFTFLRATSYVRVKHSEAFYLHVPSIMSVELSPALALGDIRVESRTDSQFFPVYPLPSIDFKMVLYSWVGSILGYSGPQNDNYTYQPALQVQVW